MNGDHFTLDEFACKDGTPCPAIWIFDRWPILHELCNKIRARWSGIVAVPSLEVVSGYRTEAWNAELRMKSIARLIAHGASEEEAEHNAGPAAHSQHEELRAADLKPLGGSVTALHAMVLAMHDGGDLPELGGLGLYPRWIHVDCRPQPVGGHLARWSG